MSHGLRLLHRRVRPTRGESCSANARVRKFVVAWRGELPLVSAYSFVAMLLALMASLFNSASTSAAPPEGTDRDIDSAIVKALRYIASQQQPSGGWNVDSMGGEATSAASLAVMSFLAAGHTPDEGPYGAAISRGVQYVINHQEPNGLLIHRRGHGPMYDHGISTLMLAEVSGMVSEQQADPVRKSLERATRLILESQNVAKQADQAGGWRYQPASTDSDLSVTGWQLLALRAAKDIGADVPAANIDAAIGYVKRCAARDGRGFCYQAGGGGATPVLTGTGLLALTVCGEDDCAEVHGAADFLRLRPLRYGDAWYFYGLYYTTIGMYKRGGDDWDRTRSTLFLDLLAQQEPDGSWKAANGNEKPFGRIYSTSMAVLALSIEYGYLPIYQR
jgi:Prenyltransferase and squalene oxidase repeat